MKKIFLKILYELYAFFAKIYLRRTKIQIIGITGSVGKTSCRMIVTQILQKYLPEKKIYTSPKNFNSEIGIVLSIFGINTYKPGIISLLKLTFSLFFKSIFMKKNFDILILEYGVDHPNDMDHYLKIGKPEYSIFTKLDYVHSGNFDTKEDLWKEKAKLFQNTQKLCFLNSQDDFQLELAKTLKTKYLFYNKDGFIYKYLFLENKVIADVDFGDLKFQTKILGEESFIYIQLAFILLEEIENIDFNNDMGFLDLDKQDGRFSIFLGKNDSILIDSSYNACYESNKKMIENVLKLHQDLYSDYSLMFVLGDMREIGKDSQILHNEIFELVKFKGNVVSVGEQTGNYFGKHLGNFKYSDDAGKFIADFLSQTENKYLILFKGSQNTIFLEEAIKKVLLDKADEIKLPRNDQSRMKKKNKFFHKKR